MVAAVKHLHWPACFSARSLMTVGYVSSGQNSVSPTAPCFLCRTLLLSCTVVWKATNFVNTLQTPGW